MERLITNGENSMDAIRTASFEKAVLEMEKETAKVGETCCNQLLKNLLITNLKLLKLNEISTMLLF